ncbi:MAG: molybdenum cofactor biosynthesis protein MoaE [Alphaproteobacteria bacterium]
MMIRVQSEDFDVGAELAALVSGSGEIGGVASFLGLVRGGTGTGGDAGGVTAMTLEHYPGMTEKALAGIEAEANSRWPLAASLIIHRYGRLLPGERIVLVATASAHREAAFAACQFLVDWLKTRAPFWKYEETPAGGRWVEARAEDETAATRWGAAAIQS